MAKQKNMISRELLPEEIVLFEILPKVPGKSLLRFKCVCKQWRSFITSPSFANIHLHHVTTTTNNNNNEKVVFFLNGSRNFQTLDCHEDGLIATPPRCHPFQGSYASLIATPVNGLVLVRLAVAQFIDIILWNPLTGVHKTIPRPPFDTNCNYVCPKALRLCHTRSDDDYKILSITTDRGVYIYSLKSDSWRKLESTPYYQERIPYAGAGDDDNNLLDEKLCFLSRLAPEVDNGKRRNVITRLHLKTEKFTKIAVPPSCERDQELKFAVVRGCIQLMAFKRARELPKTLIIEMWQMNGRDWTKMMNISYSPHNHNPMPKSHYMRPLYLMRNGNFIGYTGNGICKVDPEKNTVDHFCSNLEIAILPRIYIETFVSPNQYVKSLPINVS